MQYKNILQFLRAINCRNIKMLHDPNIGQGVQRQFSKTIELYFRPVQNDAKHKNNPHAISRAYQGVSIGFNERKNSIHAQNSKITNFLHKLEVNIIREYQKFTQEMGQLKKRIQIYYHQLKRIIQKHENQLIAQIQQNEKLNIEAFSQHLQKVKRKRVQIDKQNLMKSFQQQKADFKDLAVIQVSIFRIQGNSFKGLQNILQKFLQQFKPFISFSKINKSNESKRYKENQQPHYSMNESISNSEMAPNQKKSSEKNQQNESTIKKQSNASVSPNYTKQFNSVCEFSCDEKLEWNQSEVRDLTNNFNLNYQTNIKKQIISEVIVEEPSSCEDSLMISDVS